MSFTRIALCHQKGRNNSPFDSSLAHPQHPYRERKANVSRRLMGNEEEEDLSEKWRISIKKFHHPKSFDMMFHFLGSVSL
jgi:hypothetical protein